MEVPSPFHVEVKSLCKLQDVLDIAIDRIKIMLVTRRACPLVRALRYRRSFAVVTVQDCRLPEVVEAYAVPVEQRNRSCLQNARGIDQLISYAGPSLRFFQMPRASFADVLFQPRETDDSSQWAAVCLRSSGTLRPNGGASFTLPRTQMAVEFPQIFFDGVNKNFFVFPEPLRVTSLTLCKGRGWRHDVAHVERTALGDVLKELYFSGVRRTKLKWLSNGPCYGRDRISLSGLARLWEAILGPCGLKVEFPRAGSFYHNAEISGRKVLHRVLGKRKSQREGSGYGTALYRNIQTQSSGRMFAPFHADDGIEYLSVGLFSQEVLQGYFLFPAEILIDRGIFARSGSGFVPKNKPGTLVLYPPSVLVNLCPSVRSAHEWQSQFYMDLQDPAKLENSRDRFLRILNG